MELEDIIDKIDVWQEWHDKFYHFVPKFIESAQSCESWQDWDNDLFYEFFERGGGQCVSSLQQGYFTKEEKASIKDDWKKLAPMLKKIAESQDKPLWNEYNEIKMFIRKHTGQNRKAATNRLIASLQPNLLCTIVQEDCLSETFTLIRNASLINFPDYDCNSWFKNSYHLLEYFKSNIAYGSVYDICTYPWQVRDYLKKSSERQIHKMENIKSYIELLKENKNLVLTGAPGTGKTYLAKEVAKAMDAEVEFVQFHPSYDYTDFVEGLRPIEKTDGQMGFERKDGVFKEFCKKAIKNLVDSTKSIESLTKELSWEEKLQQFVDDATESNTIFKLSNGNEFTIEEIHDRTIIVHNEQNEKTTRVSVNADEIIELLAKDVQLNIVRDIRNHFNRKYGTQPDSYAFIITKEIRNMKGKDIVHSADKIERKNFVFIIDEINRGEASKIFGELFYAIDPGYRGLTDVRVKTQYQNLVPETDAFASGFYVPENIYILATMNDIDRSVESMDFAMRRRFTWAEVTPADTDSMLDSLTCASKAKATMNQLNAVISETDGLGVAYQVGPSYFLKLKTNGCDFDKLWKMNIEPLLKEYLRGFRKASEILDKFHKAYFANDTASVVPNN